MMVRAFSVDIIAASSGAAWDPKVETGPHPFMRVPYRDVRAAVSEAFDISIAVLKADSSHRVAHARAALIFWARRLCKVDGAPMSYPNLAQRLGYADHTTPMHADRRAAWLWASRPYYARIMDGLSRQFLGVGYAG